MATHFPSLSDIQDIRNYKRISSFFFVAKIGLTRWKNNMKSKHTYNNYLVLAYFGNFIVEYICLFIFFCHSQTPHNLPITLYPPFCLKEICVFYSPRDLFATNVITLLKLSILTLKVDLA